MVDSAHLPELPLMVAGVPEPVVAVLRRTGLPTKELPKIPLAADGTGRFLLFDSRVPSSVTRMRTARKQGLEPIDLAEIDTSLPGGLWDFEDDPGSASHSLKNGPKAFLEQLKLRLESLGGVWLRIADYPYPFRSALAVGIVHGESPVPQPYACGITLTHFLGSRLREEDLRGLWFADPHELGWAVDGDDIEATSRKTQSRWRTRMDRFREAGREIEGYRCEPRSAGLPSLAEQVRLGLRYRVECERAVSSGRPAWDFDKGEQVRLSLEDASRLMDGSPGDALGTVLRLDHESRRAGRLDADHVLNSSVIALPSALRPVLLSRIASSRSFEEWFRTRVESGAPMFLEVAAELADFPGLQKLAILADGSPFLWKCTFSQFARWQMARRRTCAVVRRTGEGYEVQLPRDVTAGGFAAVGFTAELWRGGHVARLPLASEGLSIPDEGVLYQPAEGACPGGTSVPATPREVRPTGLRKTGSNG
jgi:hypothetical protein